MKFVCGHCKAKYQLADEKIAGRTLRMTCRSCGREILIRADPSQSSAGSTPAPSATALLGGASGTSAAHGPGGRASIAVSPRGAAPPAPPPAPLHAPLRAPTPLGARSSLAPPRAVPPPPPSPLGADFRAAGTPAPAAQPGPPDEWHVAIDDQPMGPIHRDEVARKIAAGALGPDSLAWREGLDDWMPIHDIPELFVLCRRPGAPAAAPMQPSAIGGRGGAAPGVTVEDWAPLQERSALPAAFAAAAGHALTPVPPAPVSVSQPDLSALRGTRMPSLPVLFALMGGFAFLMSLVAILGARFLARDATAAAPVAAPAAPIVQPVAEAAREAPREVVLEEQVLEQEIDDKPRSSGSRSGGTKPKKELTDAQKAMLARMGGDGADLSGLSATKSADSAAPARASSGSLTAAELSGVVNRNKKQLQRCYETALRGAGSDDTVRLDVSITIAPSGGVSAVQLGGQGLPGMSECIERTVKTWRFPSAGEASATRFPLLFQPGA